MDNIHDQITFQDRKRIVQKEFIIFNIVKEGRVQMKDKFSMKPSEYFYSLYEWGLVIFEGDLTPMINRYFDASPSIKSLNPLSCHDLMPLPMKSSRFSKTSIL